jgi:hypothetical protein
MQNDRTRLIVRKTVDRMKARYGNESAVNKTLDEFMADLDFNLDLVGVPQVTGRKPKPKAKPQDATTWAKPQDATT